MRNDIKDGGPAFPSTHPLIFDSDPRGPSTLMCVGMSLRDYFAAHAPPIDENWFLQYCKNIGVFSHAKTTADWRFAYADAMLKARES